MSLSHRTEVNERQKEDADRNHSGYGFVLVLVCVGLVVLLAIPIFDAVAESTTTLGWSALKAPNELQADLRLS
jgi:hypothetical protein